jgi:hypothetical protein
VTHAGISNKSIFGSSLLVLMKAAIDYEERFVELQNKKKEKIKIKPFNEKETEPLDIIEPE